MLPRARRPSFCSALAAFNVGYLANPLAGAPQSPQFMSWPRHTWCQSTHPQRNWYCLPNVNAALAFFWGSWSNLIRFFSWQWIPPGCLQTSLHQRICRQSEPCPPGKLSRKSCFLFSMPVQFEVLTCNITHGQPVADITHAAKSPPGPTPEKSLFHWAWVEQG